MQTEPEKDIKRRRVFGRRLTRSLSPSLQNLHQTMLDKLQVPRALVEQKNLKPADIFDKPFNQFWFEIGFGNGVHLHDECVAHPDTAFIGAEPYINGMANFLKSMENESHDNVRVWMDDAIVVLDSLADGVLDGIYILNPDPWPKKRHWKRRIVSTENVARFVRILKPGGKLVMTTDIDDLAEWMAAHAINNPQLRWDANSPADWKNPPPGWNPTKYEKKGAAVGRQQSYLVFTKTA